MKPTYAGFEAKKRNGFPELPPVGAYVVEIKKAVEVDHFGRPAIEVTFDICEGEYKGRYMEVWKDQDEKWGKAYYKGTFRLIPADGDKLSESYERSLQGKFEHNLWCIEQSNGFDSNNEPLYHWDWDEKKLVGKKVGINVRKLIYTGKDKDGNPVDKETTEVWQFETIDDVHKGNCKLMKEHDKRKAKVESNEQEFTPVESSEVSVPW